MCSSIWRTLAWTCLLFVSGNSFALAQTTTSRIAAIRNRVTSERQQREAHAIDVHEDEPRGTGVARNTEPASEGPRRRAYTGGPPASNATANNSAKGSSTKADTSGTTASAGAATKSAPAASASRAAAPSASRVREDRAVRPAFHQPPDAALERAPAMVPAQPLPQPAQPAPRLAPRITPGIEVETYSYDSEPMPMDGMMYESFDPYHAHRCEAFGGFLFLRPGNAGVLYSVEQNGTDPLTASPTGPVGIVDPDTDTGFFAGFAWALSPVSSVVARYTWFDANDSNSLRASAGRVLAAQVTHPSVANCGDTSVASNADMSIEFQLVDVDYRRLLHCGDVQTLNWLAGVRYGHLEQDFASRQTIGVATGVTNVTTNIDMDGFGLTLGLDGQAVHHWSGLSLYGRGLASFVSGEFKASFLQVNQFGGTAAIRNRYEDFRIVPMLETEIGLGWMSPSTRLRVSGGYQVAAWFNTINTAGYIQGFKFARLDDVSDTLTFNGWTLKFEWLW